MHTHGDHVHSHSHEDIKAFDSKEQATALVSYMLDHNKSHAEELHEITHKLEATGLGEAASLIDDAVSCFNDGNALLEAALEIMKKQA